MAQPQRPRVTAVALGALALVACDRPATDGAVVDCASETDPSCETGDAASTSDGPRPDVMDSGCPAADADVEVGLRIPLYDELGGFFMHDTECLVADASGEAGSFIANLDCEEALIDLVVTSTPAAPITLVAGQTIRLRTEYIREALSSAIVRVDDAEGNWLFTIVDSFSPSGFDPFFLPYPFRIESSDLACAPLPLPDGESFRQQLELVAPDLDFEPFHDSTFYPALLVGELEVDLWIERAMRYDVACADCPEYGFTLMLAPRP